MLYKHQSCQTFHEIVKEEVNRYSQADEQLKSQWYSHMEAFRINLMLIYLIWKTTTFWSSKSLKSAWLVKYSNGASKIENFPNSFLTWNDMKIKNLNAWTLQRKIKILMCFSHDNKVFCKIFFFKIWSVKKKFFWRGRNIKMVKIGTNWYKFTRFFVKYMFVPLQKYFFVEKKIFLRSCENKTSTCEHPLKEKKSRLRFCQWNLNFKCATM